ncbi:calcineurin-like phosphoesterase family protein [Acidisoma cellulosilytica]|uniref:Calcineurin-like phosphoesterase family protein n=1 Tax=Acidisoma cellulosilyticum TaxID=2802395 RepID=A0A964E677_9PROT|nr:calcineurin-like phosphoesterase family protein [Acidisoma cellulosilyticum]MCB8883304.1 calcineurin-like phosphoesterase family protein [Acidisoma cellulosilyticum]
MDWTTPLPRRLALAGMAASVVGQVAQADSLPAATGTKPADHPAAETAQGIVFEDKDGSGHRTADAQGIPDVMVSNGRDVVLTDAQGGWSLPVQAGDSVFVIKPTGWMTPVDPATQLPRFSTIHQPQGTPAALGLRYPGIAPTGPLPASIDFPLRRQTEPTRFNAILFTDPQPESLAELGYVRDDVVAQVTGIPAAFGITTGDLMFDDLSAYERSNRIVGTLGLPWYNCPGNHDMNYEAPDNRFSRETFKGIFGARYYAFQYGGTTFFMLDNVDYLGGHKYQGYFGRDQLGFIRNVLAHVPAEQLVVFCMHIPLRTLAGDTANFADTDWKDFLDVIRDRPAAVSFSGHTHTNEHHYLTTAGETDGTTGHHHHVMTAVSGSWWSGPFDVRGIPVALATDGAPNGFHLLSIDGASYETRLIPAHDPQRGQMRLMLDNGPHDTTPEVLAETLPGQLLGGPISTAATGSTRLVVNLYDGGPKSTLRYSIGEGGDWRPMQRVERLDPFVQDVYARNPLAIKPWVKPGKSSHIWQATLPAQLSPGTYAIRTQGIDEYGRRHDGMMVLDVTA